MVGFLVKALKVPGSQKTMSLYLHLVVREEARLHVSFYKGANLILKAPSSGPNITSQRPHLKMASHLGLEFQHVIFEGYKHPVHSKCSRKKEKTRLQGRDYCTGGFGAY